MEFGVTPLKHNLRDLRITLALSTFWGIIFYHLLIYIIGPVDPSLRSREPVYVPTEMKTIYFSFRAVKTTANILSPLSHPS